MLASHEIPNHSPELSESSVEQLASEYLQILPNQEVVNAQPVLVLFSGVPASGKSTLAKNIEIEYRGVRVSTDDIRALIKGKDLPLSDEEKHELMKKVTTSCLDQLAGGSNHLLILDASIDRVLDEVKSWCTTHDFQPYIIALQIPRSRITERVNRRIEERQIEDIDLYKQKTEKWFADQERFLEKEQPNEVLGESDELAFSYPLQ